jgi:hypothetical protein
MIQLSSQNEQSPHLVSADLITPRNPKDFKKSSVPAMDPPQLLAVLQTM